MNAMVGTGIRLAITESPFRQRVKSLGRVHGDQRHCRGGGHSLRDEDKAHEVHFKLRWEGGLLVVFDFSQVLNLSKRGTAKLKSHFATIVL